jgi:anti-sigma regulatory factor (Ser/Thr protein kinase)
MTVTARYRASARPPTPCAHGLACWLMRAQHERFTCAALAPDTLTPKRARDVVGRALNAWRLPRLREGALLVTSELTTNALRHGRIGSDAVNLRLYVEFGRLVFEVEDFSPHPPEVKRLAEARDGGGGFGLHLVDDLADDWGHEFLTGARKRVWASWKI